MTVPPLAGVHHLKLPVSDLDASLGWYQRVLGARHERQFDHVDRDGQRYAVILTLPGVEVPLELRWAPVAADRMAGYDPVSLAVGALADFADWVAHLDRQHVEHSGVQRGAAGHLLVFADPDGTYLRLLELPAGGTQETPTGAGDPEPDGPWIQPASMRHPAPGESS